MTDGMLEDLKLRFRETTAERLSEIRALLGILENDRTDAVALQKLFRHFHALAGLGTTYGYPRVTELGDEGESSILPVERSGSIPTAAMLARWRALALEVERAIGGEKAHPKSSSESAIGCAFDVLIVEFDPELVSTVSQALEAEGLSTRVCSTREAGIAALDGCVPNALIVDVVLPDGSGYDVLEAMRTRPGGEAAGAIVMGTPQNFVDKLRAIRNGGDAFISKPLDLRALVRRVLAFRSLKERPPRRIMAVEDDATQRFLIQKILGGAGYEVTFCSDPALFEQTLLECMPDLLLMDVYLADHETRGYDLVRYVRQNELFSMMPVIFVTSATERQAQLQSTSSGGDLLVAKPVDWQMLLAQIDALLQRANAQRDRAERDGLTGLLTRAAFEARVRQRLGRSEPAAFVLIDVDHFKSVNDTHGHLMGDRVLGALGAMLRRSVRPTDVAGRYGGEEFALLLDGVTPEQAVPILERMLTEFSAIEHGPVGKVTFSGGAAALDGSFDASFRRADAALYEAKRSGRARVIAA